eukprot:1922426-Pyramimonas_sp.AAC.1
MDWRGYAKRQDEIRVGDCGGNCPGHFTQDLGGDRRGDFGLDRNGDRPGDFGLARGGGRGICLRSSPVEL